MQPAPELVDLQRWFLHQVTGDSGLAAGPAAVEDRVHGSDRLGAAERLGIYRGMYFARLHEALGEDFPGVAALLGDAGFSRLVDAYLVAHPPASFTVAHVGRALPGFLAGHPEHGGRAARDVAALEWAIAAAFDAESRPALAADRLAAVTGEAWPEARFRVTPGFALLASEVDVHAVLDAVAAGQPVSPPPLRPTFTVVWRKGFTVWRRPIDEAAFVTLRALDAGAPVAEALADAIDRFETHPAELEQRVSEWFRRWLEDGLFAAVELPARDLRRNS